MKPVEDKEITVRYGCADGVGTMKKKRANVRFFRFNADTSSSMPWKFTPQQREVKVTHT